MNVIKIHPDFRLNGQKIASENELLTYVKNYLPAHFSFIKMLFNQEDFIMAQTSGSTGKPKQITIEKKYLINSAQNTFDFFGLNPGIKALLNLSSDFIAGKMMWVRALTGGWHLDVISPENRTIYKQLSQKTYDFGAMVPLQVQYNIDKIANVKKLIIGGGVVSDNLKQKIFNLPNSIFATYGMTETVTHIAVKPLNKRTIDHFYSHEKLTGSYKVMNGVQISKDKRNCLVIEAPCLAKNKVVTNDLVEIVDKNHFKWLGRYDNIINSGGLKFIPEQIEAKLKHLIPNNFFIAGIPDDILGQKIVMFVEGRVDKEKLFQDFKGVLDKFEQPKQVVELQSFNKTSSGKINRLKTIEAFFS